MKYAGPVLRSAQTIIAGSSTCTFHPIRLLQSPCDRLRTCPQPRSRRNVRYNSTTSATASTSPKASSASAAIPHAHPAFEDLATGLSRVQPCFGARGDEIELIGSPSEFYQTLLKMIGRARRRIIISSLYIGAEEETLVGFSSLPTVELAEMPLGRCHSKRFENTTSSPGHLHVGLPPSYSALHIIRASSFHCSPALAIT